MAKKDEGKKYLESILALVPEDRRAAVAESLGADAILETLGDGVLKQSDYSRKMNEVTQKETELKALNDRHQNWYRDQLGGLANAAKWQKEAEESAAKLKALEARGTTTDDGTATATVAAAPDLSQYVKREDAVREMREALAQSETNSVGFMRDLTQLSMRHFKDYGEILDTDALIKKTFELRQPLPIAYATLTQDLAAKRSEKLAADSEAKIRSDEREKVRAEMSARGPYPIDDGAEPSTLSGLGKDCKEYGTTAAVAEFYANKRANA